MFYRWVHRIVLPILRLLYRVRIRGRENVPPGAALFCGNHTSLKDPLFMAMVLDARRPLRFMAKEELFRIPVFGFLIRKLGAFPVERGRSDLAAVRAAVEILQAGGRLMIFPDGRRVSGRGQGPLRLGAAMIASRAGVPVVPVCMSWPKRLFRPVTVTCGPLIWPEPREEGGASGAGERYRALTRRIDEGIWEAK